MLRTLLRFGVVAPLVAGSLTLAHGVGPAAADSFVVTDPSDDAATPNTLRWALAQASADPAAPTVDIAPGLVIDLTCIGGGALAYDSVADHALTIVGNGATITQTCPASAVLTSATESLVLRDVTLAGGSAGGVVSGDDILIEDSTVMGTTAGGGVTAYAGTATISRSTLHDNTGSAGGAVGAIHVVITDSTISDNRANTGGGAWADQSLTAVNATVSGNDAAVSGGGIYAGLNQIDLAYATIVDNGAPVGANVHLDFSSQITSFASIIGTPLAGGSNCELDVGATVVSLGANVTSDSSCGFDSGPNDVADTDPGVAALADNGGPTRTRLPAITSPALDRADCTIGAQPADQRGVPRPQGSACDAGAVEVSVQPGADDPPTTIPDGGSEPMAAGVPARAVAATPRFTG